MGIFGTSDITQIQSNPTSNGLLVAAGLNPEDLALRCIAYDDAGNFRKQQHFQNPTDESLGDIIFTIIEGGTTGIDENTQVGGVEEDIQVIF